MVIDYSERRQSQRMQAKRPPRPSVWPYALLIISMLFSAYLFGVGTGWYLYRPGGKFYKQAPQPQAQPAKSTVAAKPQPAPSADPATAAQGHPAQPGQQQPLNALPQPDKNSPIPLTFYNTLQKGHRELMGTGINQPKDGQAGVAKPASHDQSEQ